MKYEFKYISLDHYELRYTDKTGTEQVKPFVRDVKMASKIQGIQATARLNMFKELSAQGLTKNDLIVKHTNADGTISYDESNYREYEQTYTQIASANILNEIVKDSFGLDLIGLLSDMGIDVQSQDPEVLRDVEMFSKKLITILMGSDEQDRTPSVASQEQVSTTSSTE